MAEIVVSKNINFNKLKEKISNSIYKDNERIEKIVIALEKGEKIPFEITHKEYTFISQLSRICIDKKGKNKSNNTQKSKEEPLIDSKKDHEDLYKVKKKNSDNNLQSLQFIQNLEGSPLSPFFGVYETLVRRLKSEKQLKK